MATRRPNAAILCAAGVEQIEVTEPRKRLEAAGVEVMLVGPTTGDIRAYHYIEPGDELHVDLSFSQVSAEMFDCLVIPGGLGGPDTLRNDEQAVRFVRDYWHQGRLVGVICHGPWLLIEAGVLTGRRLTCADQISSDVANAGGEYVNADAHLDADTRPVLVSGRNHSTVGAFADVLVDQLSLAPLGDGRGHHAL